MPNNTACRWRRATPSRDTPTIALSIAIITVVIDVIAADGSPTVGNNPPGFGGSPGDPGTVREVAENAPGGTLVGAPVTATDWAMRRRPLRLGQPVADSRFGEDIHRVSRVVSELAAQALHK